MSDAEIIGRPQTTVTARAWHVYTSFAADINLLTDANGPADGKAARLLVVNDLGTGSVLEVEKEDNVVEQLDVTLLVGVWLPGDVITITDTTDIGALLVYW